MVAATAIAGELGYAPLADHEAVSAVHRPVKAVVATRAVREKRRFPPSARTFPAVGRTRAQKTPRTRRLLPVHVAVAGVDAIARNARTADPEELRVLSARTCSRPALVNIASWLPGPAENRDERPAAARPD
jgi:hypothetical protein